MEQYSATARLESLQSKVHTPNLLLPPLPSSPASHWAEASTLALSERLFSPSKIAALIEITSEYSIDPAWILHDTNLDIESVKNPRTLTSPQQFLIASQNALRAYPKDDLGFQLGSRLHATSYGMYGYALLSAETLRHGFEIAMKYHRLANSMIPIKWIEEGDFLSWIYPATEAIELPKMNERLYRFLIEFQISVAANLFVDAMGAWCLPSQVTFTFSPPLHANLLSQAFKCLVLFDQPQNTLSYPREWLSRSPRMANPIEAARVSVECAKLMDEARRQAGITCKVYQELTRNPGYFPDICSIANALCVTSRTVRRQLALEGTSYRELLASVRKALAIDYLSTTLMSTEDIARHLGFSDPVAFRHAFKRWTGKSPMQFRRARWEFPKL